MNAEKKRKLPLWKSLLLGGSLAALAGVLLVTGINLWVVLSTGEKILTPGEATGEQADCILVLGCGVRGEAPSPLEHIGTNASHCVWNSNGRETGTPRKRRTSN